MAETTEQQQPVLRLLPLEQVQKGLEVLEQLHDGHGIDDAVYHKCLVCLVADCFRNAAVASGLELLKKVPVSYYREQQPLQLQQDPLYAVTAAYVAEVLVAQGYVDEGLVPIATQAPAEA